MRVASQTVYGQIKINLGHLTEEMSRANQVVATGKNINNLSDDPSGVTQALDIRSSLAGFEQLRRNVTMGKSWLVASESALTGVQNLISDTKALCVQMVSANTGPDHRESASKTVANTLKEILSLANTEVNGRYIFAGSKTERLPFDQSGNYNGDAQPFAVKIGKDATIEVGADGEAVFQPSGAGASDDIFQTMSDLKTALQGNDLSGIEQAMTQLGSHFDQVTNTISDLGSKTIRMELKERIFDDLKLVNTERLSMIEDADLAAAVIDLKEIEVAYQAALNSSAKVMNLTLVDYL